jgi:hypothetical protein
MLRMTSVKSESVCTGREPLIRGIGLEGKLFSNPGGFKFLTM